MRRAARVCLTALLIGSLALTLYQGWRLASGWPGAALAARLHSEIAAGVDRALARHATPEALSARVSALLDDEPRNWMAIEAVEGVAADRGVALPEELLARRAGLHARDTGFLLTSERCLRCAWEPKACDFSAILLCRAPVDLSPLGDIAGVTREGTNIALGRPVDEVDLALSVVGLAAVVLVPATGGGSVTLKAGAGMGKTAWRMGQLSEGLTAPVRRAAREGVDWARIGTVRSTDDMAGLLRPAVLQPAIDLASDAGRLHRTLGARPGLYLLSRADTGAEARRLADAAEAMGPRSLGAFEVLGKSRFLRATMRWADEVWALLAAIAGLAIAIAALLGNLLGSAGLRFLRRLAR